MQKNLADDEKYQNENCPKLPHLCKVTYVKPSNCLGKRVRKHVQRSSQRVSNPSKIYKLD